MAAVAEVRTFWGALLSVLLKCITALGFAAPATRAAARRARTADGTLPVAAGRRSAASGATGSDTPPSRPPAGGIPAPRACQPAGTARGRSLPPTMKQRIGAEAHGSSPSARALRTADALADDFSGTMTVTAPTGGTAGTSGSGGPSAPAPASAARARGVAGAAGRARSGLPSRPTPALAGDRS